MNKQMTLFFCMILCCLMLVGCSNGNPNTPVQNENTYKVYFTNGEETMLVETTYQAKSTEPGALIEELAEAMSIVPASGAYKKVRPEDMNIFERYLLTRSGTLILYYDDTYHNLKGTTEVLYRAAVVKTLCQIEGVEGIEIYVNDEPLTTEAGTAVGVMVADDFLDNTFGELSFSQTMVVSLYFATASGDALREVRINTVYDGSYSLERMVVEQLLKGPTVITGLEEGLVQDTLPAQTSINRVSVRDGVCYVDFSEDFLSKRPEITDQATIYAVVDSLTSLEDIAGVQFLIDGQTRENYFSIKNFDGVFERSEDLILK
ncbi:MAG: GerMN domain-containing protein [Lachnospiraceae bacterium]|nr:GerMN domain-containing protein [Lachnospiraceae bacterium]